MRQLLPAENNKQKQPGSYIRAVCFIHFKIILHKKAAARFEAGGRIYILIFIYPIILIQLSKKALNPVDELDEMVKTEHFNDCFPHIHLPPFSFI